MHKELYLLTPLSSRPNLKNDWKKIFNRSINEGIGFITATLPLLGRAIYDSFQQGSFVCPTAFRKADGTMLPKLYFELFRRVYKLNGELLEQPDIEVIRGLTQLFFMFYKYEAEYKPETLNKALEKYLIIEQELTNLFLIENDPILNKARDIVTQIFRDFDPSDIVPHISSGALATGEIGADKYIAKRLYTEIHRIYPYYRYFVPSPSSITEQLKNVGFIPDGYLSWYKGLQRLISGTSKLLFVNKDARGPRSISMEPSEYQYIQQGLKDSICPHLEKVTRNQINFKDQKINGDAALRGSIDGSISTYDFSAASDRVSLELVNNLFRDVPHLLNALHACRTTHTELPDGTIIKLKKFAPMGSALCFPVMATVIYSIAKAMNDQLPVLVYGDDLIVEDDSSYAALPATFRKYGLLVNTDKSFTRGSFRESCGTDAFDGNLISPIRIKKDVLCIKPEHCAALVDSSNEFYKAGYWHLAGSLRKIIQTNASVMIPTLSVHETAPGLHFVYVTDATDDIRIKINKSEPMIEYFQRIVSLKIPKLTTRIRDEFGYLISISGGSLDSVPSDVVVRNQGLRSKIVQSWKKLHRVRTHCSH